MVLENRLQFFLEVMELMLVVTFFLFTGGNSSPESLRAVEESGHSLVHMEALLMAVMITVMDVFKLLMDELQVVLNDAEKQRLVLLEPRPEAFFSVEVNGGRFEEEISKGRVYSGREEELTREAWPRDQASIIDGLPNVFHSPM